MDICWLRGYTARFVYRRPIRFYREHKQARPTTFCRKGYIVKLNVSREVHIVNFDGSGASEELRSPIETGVIGAEDQTFVVLQKELRYLFGM